MTSNLTKKAQSFLNEQGPTHKNSHEDPNMVKLKQDLEKDALLNSPKRVTIQQPGDAPCELIASILRSSIKTSKQESDGGLTVIRLHQLKSSRSDSPPLYQPLENPYDTAKRGSVRGIVSQETFETMKTNVQSAVLRYTYDNVLLNPPIGKQADAILKHLDINNTDNSEGETALKQWREDFKHKDIKDGKVVARECSAPLAKPYYLKKLEKEIDTVYGEGTNRRLRPGEEATIISVIEDLIASFLEVDIIPHLSFSNSREQVLNVAGLSKLNEYPICIKQVDLHMRIMFTKFRCSIQYRENEKKLKKFMQMAENRNWLIDLNAGNELSNYLLKNCKIDPHATKLLKTSFSINRSPTYNTPS